MIQRSRRKPTMDPITMPAIDPELIVWAQSDDGVEVTVTVTVGFCWRGVTGFGSVLVGPASGARRSFRCASMRPETSLIWKDGAITLMPQI